MNGPLYIIGYMASGKTTFGRALASDLRLRFLDLDQEIEKGFSMSVARIIAQKGIDEFRKIEAETLRRLGADPGLVIACGGGTPCHLDNMEFMNATGTTLWLQASTGRIAERVIAAGPTRPLLAGVAPDELPAFVERHLQERIPFYDKAKLRFCSENLENENEIANAVECFRREFGLT